MNHVVDLRSGRLKLRVDSTDYPLEELCGFGCRLNRRRPFVIVSRVLGKHIPVRPGRMAMIHHALAVKLPNLPGPVAFIALAETAVGLGQGVFDQWLQLTSREDAVFLHSTRYRLARPLAFSFSETHSHAPQHFLYEPCDTICRHLFRTAQTLVLIDDELTTGRTLLNLAGRYLCINHRIRQLIFVCITDWLGSRRRLLQPEVGVPLTLVSLLRGSLEFTENPNFDLADVQNRDDRPSMAEFQLPCHFGRLGVHGPTHIDPRFYRDLLPLLSGRRVLVLGTGEFTHPPYLLAAALERLGYDVLFQSTTRSPLLEGDSLGTKLEFRDNYGEGIPNYLYNATFDHYDDVIIGYETPSIAAAHDLPERLKAKSIIF